MLVNDFSLAPCPSSEVRNVYGGQKLPCLVYFTRIDEEEEEEEEEEGGKGGLNKNEEGPRTPSATTDTALMKTAPALTSDEFKKLCNSPPLQGLQGLTKMPRDPYRFKPLDMSYEPPRPGMLLAIDAEFVALTPLTDSSSNSLAQSDLLNNSSISVSGLKGGGAVVEPPKTLPRLCLARVSVVRGEGPSAGHPCIDDHVRVVETVYDYLTRYSGIVAGDLDVTTSRHYLTTLKHSYLKLRYLADCGCVFIGHGLKKDFRMINLILPPEQTIDTVELYSFKNQRKLSLRFLASYLLGLDIQGITHDAIEDARTALKLYEKYKALVAAGTFHEKLNELYSWGKKYGFESVQIGKDGKPIIPTLVSGGSKPQS